MTTLSAICPSDELQNGGTGIRFEVEWRGSCLTAFLIRYQDEARAYLNRCAHRGVELDWDPGAFFDAEKRLLVCSTHGALYDPLSGVCVAGPCRGARLVTVPVIESEGQVSLLASDELHFYHRT